MAVPVVGLLLPPHLVVHDHRGPLPGGEIHAVEDPPHLDTTAPRGEPQRRRPPGDHAEGVLEEGGNV